MQTSLTLALLGSLIAAGGCHSPYVAATVHNGTDQALQLIEVDYPSASFGTENLAPGADFHYRFKVLGSGGTKLLYTDSSHHDHTANGPSLHEGAEGKLVIVITPAGATWKPDAAVLR